MFAALLAAVVNPMNPIRWCLDFWNHAVRGLARNDCGSYPSYPENVSRTETTYSLDSLPIRFELGDTIIICADDGRHSGTPGLRDVSLSVGNILLLRCVVAGEGYAEFRNWDKARGKRYHLVISDGRYKFSEWHELDPRVGRLDLAGTLR